MQIMKRFAQDESGATAIEYGLLAALIGVGIIAAVKGVTNGLNNNFNKVATAVDTAAP